MRTMPETAHIRSCDETSRRRISFSRLARKASGRSARQKLLRIHGEEPTRAYWLLPAMVPRTRYERAGRRDAHGAGKLSAARVSLPQKEWRAAGLHRSALPLGAAARVVPLDGAAALHPTQSGERTGTAAHRVPLAESRSDGTGSRARAATAKRERSAGTARPGVARNVVLHRHAAAGTLALEGLRSGSGARHGVHPAG